MRALSLCLLLSAAPALAQVPVARVAREGLPVPERDGHTFVSFAASAVDDRGALAFAAFTREDGGEAERGLWHMTPSGRLKLVAYEGQLITVDDEPATLHTLGAPFLTEDGTSVWVTATAGGLSQEGVLLFDNEDRLSFLGGTFRTFPESPVERRYLVSRDQVHFVVELDEEAPRVLRYNGPSRSWIPGAHLTVGGSPPTDITLYGISHLPRRLIAFIETEGDDSGLYAFDLVNDLATPLLLEAQVAPPPWVAHRVGRPAQVIVSEGSGLMVAAAPVADESLGEPFAPACPLGPVFVLGISGGGAPALVHLCDDQAPMVDGVSATLETDDAMAYIGASYALLGRAGDDDVLLTSGAVHAQTGVALGETGLVPTSLTRLGDSLAGPTLLELVDTDGVLTWARHTDDSGWEVLVGEGDVVHPDDGPLAAFLPPERRPAGSPRQSNISGQAPLRAADLEGRATLLLAGSDAQTGLNPGLRLTSSLDYAASPTFAVDQAAPVIFSVGALGQPLADVELRVRLEGGTFTNLPQLCQPLDDDVSELACDVGDIAVDVGNSVDLAAIVLESTGARMEVTATGRRADGTTYEAARHWALLDEASADLGASLATLETVGADVVELGVFVDNRGPSRATDVRLTCSVLDGVQVTPVSGAGDCEPVENQLGTVWTCGLGTLELFEGVEAIVRLENLPPAGEVSFICDATSSVFDPFPGNNTIEFPVSLAPGDGDGDPCDGLCGDGDGDGDGRPVMPMGPFGIPLPQCVCTHSSNAPPPAVTLALLILFALSARPRRRR